MPTIGSGSRFEASYIAETVFGTTPTTPTMKAFPVKSFNVNLSRDELRSATLRADQQLAYVRSGNEQVGGSIGVEFGNKYDDLLAAVVGGTWTTNTMKAGTLTPSFSVEARHTDLTQYRQFKGTEITSFSLSVQPNAPIDATFNVVGSSMTVSGTTLGAPTAYTGFVPYDSFSGTITEGGSAIASVTGVDITIDRGLTPNFTVGSRSIYAITPGQNIASGTLNVYFESAAMLAKFTGETVSSLALTVGNGTASHTFTFHQIKYSGAEINVDGPGPLTIAMPFVAVYDSTAQTNLTITRVP